MRERLVITGMGAITPIGLCVDEYWRNLIAGHCGIGAITRFDASRLPTRIAAEVKGFDDRFTLPGPLNKAASRFMRFAWQAAVEALEDAGISQAGANGNIGICMGTALAGVEEVALGQEAWTGNVNGKVSPHMVPKTIANIAAAHLSILWGLHGPGLTVSTACSAGNDALLAAALLILAGEAECMVVMAGESAIIPVIVSSLSQAKALSRCNDDPQSASRPFDRDRDGFVIGEGGGALVLETEKNALSRGARIHAELSGWGNNLDGYHITAPDPDGKWAALCMKKALASAGMTPEEIDYINVHGTGTTLGDTAETRALKTVFGPNVPPVSSTKGATGHLMSAGGLTEAIACVKAVETGVIPPTLNLHNPDPECDLDYVPLKSRKVEVRHAMSNSLGFGGQNSSVIVSRHNQERV